MPNATSDRVRQRTNVVEGIVSKRRNSSYRSGRSLDWIKSKNPAAPAVKREAEEDWGR
jgi:ATP-dependent DNA ligase